MTLYFLLVSLWVPFGEGMEQETLWAMNTGMTYAECEELRVNATPYIEMLGGVLSCEVDHAS